ncbi:GNAT family N-acetyltransferase [Cytobacillus sp. FSL R7-0680]|uniref:GNAT family N-acetyltransferase n=1 Tax=Cytobacillus sp. FSL R7-0680 TaxID=2921689 RepID=UPI0030FA6D67
MGEMLIKGFRMLDGKKFYIRHAESSDANELLLFTKDVIEQSPYLLIEPNEYQVSFKQQQQKVQQVLEDPSKLLLIAVFGEEIIGRLDFSVASRKKIAHTGTFGMSVSQSFRGKGVGKALLSSLLLWGRQHPKVEKIELEVLAENKAAIHLYESAGFAVEGVKRQAVKNRFNEYDDLILMSYFFDNSSM